MIARIDAALGQCEPHFVPGCLRLYSRSITLAALWIPVALQIIHSSEQIMTTTDRWREGFKSMFVLKKDESTSVGCWRIFNNVCRLAVYGILGTTSVVSLVYAYQKGLINTEFAKGRLWISQRSTVKTIQTYVEHFKILELQLLHAPKLIYTSYGLLGLVHLWKAGKEQLDIPIQKIKHLFASIIAFTTVLMMRSGRVPVAWTYSAMGLLFMLPQLYALNTMGSLLVNDSLFYWVKPNRDTYDFPSIFVANLNPFITQLSYLSAIQIISDRFFGTPKQVDKGH